VTWCALNRGISFFSLIIVVSTFCMLACIIAGVYKNFSAILCGIYILALTWQEGELWDL
jgi:hypothetical protein